MNVTLYFHPVGTPLSSWNGVPIMPQATAGQEFNAQIYSFVASANLSQAQQFYAAQAAALSFVNAPATGSGGSGSQATHDVTFYSYKISIILTSFDSDPDHVIVVISKVQ
jgi:hypothetical protein